MHVCSFLEKSAALGRFTFRSRQLSVQKGRRPVVVRAQQPTAVISGTANTDGIGRACLREFLEAGYKVVGLDVQPPQDEESDEILSRFQGAYKMLQTDISNENEVQAAVDHAQSFLGGSINSLVNNAGIALSTMSEEPGQRLASFQKFLSVNLIGTFIVSEACLKFMPDGHASIVNVSSIQATASWPNTEGYASAKAGMRGLTRAQAVSLDKRVRVNTVLPGWIITPGSQAEITQELHDWHLTGRAGKASDIAHAVLFLCDNKRAAFITGQELMVDGGVSAKLVYPE